MSTRGCICKYPAKQHAQRISAKLKLPKSLILLQGEKSEFFSNSDMPRPFRQDRYFYYMTGCNEPGCYVTYDTDKDKLTLWIPPVDFSMVYYNGRGSTVEEAMELYDIDEAMYLTGQRRQTNLSVFVKQHYENGGECLFLREKTDVIQKPLRMKMNKSRQPGLILREAMDACRAVKDEHEIGLIRKANEISSEAHTKVMKQLHRLKNEPQVEGLFVGTCTSHRAREQSYAPICGSGANASQLHYVDNDQDFGKRQVLLIDAGAEWQDHASDITRTMPINPKNPGHWQSKEAEAVYKHVEKIQEACIAQLGPGKSFIEVNFAAVHMAIDGLLDLGILKGEHMEIFKSGTILAFFPHGLGHHVGLEVHDVQPPIKWNISESQKKEKNFTDLHRAYQDFVTTSPSFTIDYISNDPEHFSIDPRQCLSPVAPLEPPLEAGMVVTIEPGIYFNQFILDRFLDDPEKRKFIDEDVLEKFMHVGGVRIEDCILITKDGYENLTTAPKGEKMLEVIREGACGNA